MRNGVAGLPRKVEPFGREGTLAIRRKLQWNPPGILFKLET